MPSKDMNDVLAVEELVHEIKENLRLKARPSHNHGRNSRPSPYHIPCRSWNDQQQHQQNHNSSTIQQCNNANCSNNLINNCNNSNSNDTTMIGFGTTNTNYNCNNSTQNQQQQHNHNNQHQKCCTCKNNKKQTNNIDDIDDPYELLQALLKKQNLVKEAVRRLQLNSISPKQKSYFYESDDDGSTSPIYGSRVCQLEL